MADFVFKFDKKDFDRAAMLFPVELYQEEKTALERGYRSFNAKIARQQLSGPAVLWVKPRTGTMRRSLKGAVLGKSIKDLMMVSYFDTKQAPYAPFHEGPGFTTVTQKRAKWLAIPTKEALTPSGVIRSQYAAMKGATLRSVPGLFLVKKYIEGTKTIEWMGLAVRRGGKKGGIRLIYVFKKSITYRRKMRFEDQFVADVTEGGDIYKEIHKGLESAAKRFSQRGGPSGKL